jgi:enoyl-CoA hydratase/carnithine racemase
MTVRFARSGAVGTLTLDRQARRNALTPRMCAELAAFGAELERDHALRCLVVTGAGSAFSAGLDLEEGMAMLAEWAELPVGEELVARGLRLAESVAWIPRLRCPSVAAVRGPAYGAGGQLALACDFRIFADDARLGLVETRYGLLPDMGATVRLPRLVGDGRARRMILLGEVVDAPEALRIGLADEVVPHDAVDVAAAGLARRLAAQPPLAVRGARRAMEAAWGVDVDAGLRAAVEAQAVCLTSADFAEGRRALAEGRPPCWRGQ